MLKVMSVRRRAILVAGTIAVWAVGVQAQDPLKTLPTNYQKVFENETVTVVRAHYGGHEKIPVHDHAGIPTVFVYLNDSGPVRIDHAEADGRVDSITRPSTIKGSYRVAGAMAERHSIENLGDASSDFLRVELKRVDLKLPEPFRGKAPASLVASAEVVEFSNPTVQIERIVCAESASCPIKAKSAGSLLIAFTPLHLQLCPAGVEKNLEAGAVLWLGSGENAQIAAPSTGAAHVLRILIPDPTP